jgi:NADH-quinone oxidoreductase subunit J
VDAQPRLDVTTGAQAQPANYSNTAELGKLLYTEYVYPFELAAVLLLIAIVAAISLTMRKRAGLKQQNVRSRSPCGAKIACASCKVAAERPGPRDPEKGA